MICLRRVVNGVERYELRPQKPDELRFLEWLDARVQCRVGGKEQTPSGLAALEVKGFEHEHEKLVGGHHRGS